jgi:hypothetical protein
MRIRAWRVATFLLLTVLGTSSCRKTVVVPTYRRPVITSIVAFPTTLGVGDSTMITIRATDPDPGDSLVYDWNAFNGLVMKGTLDPGRSYGCRSPSMVFYRSPDWPYPAPYDTAFVWCTVSDQRGGSGQRQVLILYQD